MSVAGHGADLRRARREASATLRMLRALVTVLTVEVLATVLVVAFAAPGFASTTQVRRVLPTAAVVAFVVVAVVAIAVQVVLVGRDRRRPR